MATGIAPAAYPQSSLTTHWLLGVLVCLLMLGSVILHEGAHLAASRLLGVRLRRVILFPFGGISETERQGLTWRGELLQAGVGPLINLVIGVILTAYSFVLEQPLAAWLGIFNLALAAWNLIPAEPLDGIRFLHALARKRGASATKLTRVGFRVADTLGVTLVWLGLPVAVVAGFGAGLLLVLYGSLLQIANNVYLAKRDPRSWSILHSTAVGQMVSNASPDIAQTTIRFPDRGRKTGKRAGPSARLRPTGSNCARQVGTDGSYLPSAPRTLLTRWMLPAEARLVDALEMLDRPDAPEHLLVVDNQQVIGVCSRDDLLDHLHSRRDRVRDAR